MKTLRKTIFWLLVFQLASVPLVVAQGTYTQIDVPGAYSTSVVAINAVGDMVGEYFDITGQHGFLLSQGDFKTIDVPNAPSTSATGINDVGQLVGVDGTGSGFLYDIATQTFTTIRYPGPAELTSPAGINNAGTIVGTIQKKGTPVVDNAFVFCNGVFSLKAVMGSKSSFATGINNVGDIVGDFLDPSGVYESFILSSGKLRNISVPGVPSAIVIGTNDNQVFVGVYEPKFGKIGQAGFVYASKTFQLLVPPHTAYSYAAGVNNSGEVAGYYVGNDGNAHGFTWTPPGDAAKK